MKLPLSGSDFLSFVVQIWETSRCFHTCLNLKCPQTRRRFPSQSWQPSPDCQAQRNVVQSQLNPEAFPLQWGQQTKQNSVNAWQQAPKDCRCGQYGLFQNCIAAFVWRNGSLPPHVCQLFVIILFFDCFHVWCPTFGKWLLGNLSSLDFNCKPAIRLRKWKCFIYVYISLIKWVQHEINNS